jgi:transcriptional regulator with XRE-family HTH domain
MAERHVAEWSTADLDRALLAQAIQGGVQGRDSSSRVGGERLWEENSPNNCGRRSSDVCGPGAAALSERTDSHLWCDMTGRPPTARRIRAAREKLNLSHDEVAQLIGMSRASYYDLESYDDEAFMAISLRDLLKLGSALRVAARDLVDDDGAQPPAEQVTYEELAAGVRAQIEAEGMDVDTWGTKVGWDVADLLRDPTSVADLNLDGLCDICAAVGVDWRAVLVG